MMRRDERAEIKKWLTNLLPEGMSRNDVAEELGVTRKTISAMLNPDQPGFGNGLTMLRYLQLVGAVAETPVESPGASRLRALEERVAESLSLTREMLEFLRQDAEAPQVRRRDSK